MKKLSMMVVVAGVAACVSSCSHKMHANLMDPEVRANAAKTAPNPTADATYVPFTRLKRQQLERSNVDLTQLQFYIDQKIVLTRMSGSDRAVVKGGTIVKESARNASELVIPEYTPVVCDRVVGDTLMISFETPNNDIAFGTPYGGTNYSVLGTNWINGSADVMYDGQTYRIKCGSCNNVAQVQLMVKETNVDKSTSANKTVAGRKLYK